MTPTSASCDAAPTRDAAPDRVHPQRPGTADLVIAGLTAFSTCDWPGHLSATVFLQGCPWQCTYCQNPGLMDARAAGLVPWSTVRSLLERRRGSLDGLVFSGGEPTRQRALGAAMQEARDLGFAVGLHTAGSFPRRLAAVLPMTSWVGLDIKAPKPLYVAVTGAAASATNAWESLRLVRDSGVDYEVRITVDPSVFTRADVIELIEDLRAAGVGSPVLQEVRALGTRPGYAERLGGLRLRDVVPAGVLPGIERRVAEK
jgi:pyruvate formate lyase activating enzyme